MNALLQDLRYVTRALLRMPAFAVSAGLSLALGIGLSTPLLSLLRTGLLRPLPYTPFGSSDQRSIRQIQDQALDVLFWTLLAATLLALGIACVNLVSLLLSRATVRQHEMAMRATLGADRRRIMRQLVTEGAALSLIGASVGVLLGALGARLLRDAWTYEAPSWLAAGLDVRILVGAVTLFVLLALAFGLAPLPAALRPNLYDALTAGTRATAGPREGRIRAHLIILAVAGTLVLLTGAGLLIRSFIPLQSAEALGFDPRSTLTLKLDLTDDRYASDQQRADTYDAVLARVQALPGIEDTSVASQGAWVGLGTEKKVRAVCGVCYRGSMLLPVTRGVARHHAVSPGFFLALGVPILQGREFAQDDRTGTPGVAVVNRTFAYRLFPGGDPVGKRVLAGNANWYTIVGVVEDIRAHGIGTGAEPVPGLYLSAIQVPPRTVGLAVRTAGDPLQHADAIRRAIHTAGPLLVPSPASTMKEELARFRAPLHWFAQVFTVLAALATLLAAVGLGSVITHHVARRTREIGIRMAIGAQGRTVLRMVVGQSLRLTLTGTVLGLFGALCLARVLQVFFFGFRALDPVIYGSVALLLGAVALVTSWLPARRAARVDPTIALQAE
ncbi:MAG: FtsX-like permease family protein [Gemmatimonadota bacterium]|nr:FtsX-like permease family protein [Gemmatimonadota bacterium]